ncbi:hypothetical protein [Streptomyces sp. NPDC047108]|uniref:hypothetical protein n=1 Tax=Streptomyces sp. NPDC047108 TaxID=3155025 RepID=UPI0033CC6185
MSEQKADTQNLIVSQVIAVGSIGSTPVRAHRLGWSEITTRPRGRSADGRARCTA